MALVRALLARSGDPSISCRTSAVLYPDAWPSTCVSVVSALLPTARDAMRLFAENAHLLDATFAISFFETPEEARIVFTDDELDLGELRRFYMEHSHLAVVVGFWRSLRSNDTDGPANEPWSRVNFDYARPTEASRYEAFFRCPVRFGVEHERRRGQPEAIDHAPCPARTASTSRRSGCASSIGDEATDADLVAVVRRLVAVQVGIHHTLPRADENRRAPEISDRTLRDQLAKRDTSFREMLERAVAQRAKFHLREGVETPSAESPSASVTRTRRVRARLPSRDRHDARTSTASLRSTGSRLFRRPMADCRFC